jgi:hypothetical protein
MIFYNSLQHGVPAKIRQQTPMELDSSGLADAAFHAAQFVCVHYWEVKAAEKGAIELHRLSERITPV